MHNAHKDDRRSSLLYAILVCRRSMQWRGGYDGTGIPGLAHTVCYRTDLSHICICLEPMALHLYSLLG